MVFSGGISALVLPIITKLSPEGTAFTLPLNHPVAPAVDAISTAIDLQKLELTSRSSKSQKKEYQVFIDHILFIFQ